MTKVILHGKFGEDIGREWDLEIENVAEALRAIDANTQKLRKWLINNHQEEFFIYVNKEHVMTKTLNENSSLEDIKNSELFFIFEKLESIDIVPKIEGSGGFFKNPIVQIVTGAIALVAAIAMPFALGFSMPVLAGAVGLGLAGASLLLGGVSQLLAKPPPSVPYTAQQVDPIQGASQGGASSYLFNGPTNTVGEGGPVPVGYGELLIGGNNVFSSYEVFYKTYIRDIQLDNLKTSTKSSLVDSYLFNDQYNLIRQTAIYDEPQGG